MKAENIYQVFDWLWSSGQLSVEDISELPKLGIKHVINLAVPTSNNALAGEAELISNLGINYFQIPVIWDSPDVAKLKTFIQLLSSLNGQKTWVHCAKNMRVSAFIYLYRLFYVGESDAAASFPMNEIWEPNEVWSEFIRTAKNAFDDGTLKMSA